MGGEISPGSSFWFTVILAILLTPSIATTLLELVRKPDDMLITQHWDSNKQIIHRRFYQLLFYLACLPHEAWYSTVAIVRTKWRLLVSHRHLLEWTPSDQIDHTFHDTPGAWFAKMWMGPAVALSNSFIFSDGA